MIDRISKAVWVKYTKCPNCGRKSQWSNPYDITSKHVCWGCKEEVKMIKITDKEFWVQNE